MTIVYTTFTKKILFFFSHYKKKEKIEDRFNMLKCKVNTNGISLLSLISQVVLAEDKYSFLKQIMICESNNS